MKAEFDPRKFVTGMRESARRAHETADEMTAWADRRAKKLTDHECGHEWTITVTGRGHYGIVGDPNGCIDANYTYTHKPVTVRANSLPSALRRAAALPLTAWFDDEDDTDADT